MQLLVSEISEVETRPPGGEDSVLHYQSLPQHTLLSSPFLTARPPVPAPTPFPIPTYYDQHAPAPAFTPSYTPDNNPTPTYSPTPSYNPPPPPTFALHLARRSLLRVASSPGPIYASFAPPNAVFSSGSVNKFLEVLQRERSLLTIYWSEST